MTPFFLQASFLAQKLRQRQDFHREEQRHLSHHRRQQRQFMSIVLSENIFDLAIHGSIKATSESNQILCPPCFVRQSF